MLISVLCVSKRPSHVAQAISNFRRQRWTDKEFVFVANSGDFDLDLLKESLRGVPNARFLSAEGNLGAGLNHAIESSSGRLWAKFDDDDEYGPRYLQEAATAFGSRKAPLIGKRSYFMYLAEINATILRGPGNENKRTKLVSGATLVGDREVLAKYPFDEEARRGVDTMLINSLLADGVRPWSTSRYGFMATRRADRSTHTWNVDLETLTRRAELVGTGKRLRLTGCR